MKFYFNPFLFKKRSGLQNQMVRPPVDRDRQIAFSVTAERLAAGVRVSPERLDAAVIEMLLHYLDKTNNDKNPNHAARIRAIEIVRALKEGPTIAHINKLHDRGF